MVGNCRYCQKPIYWQNIDGLWIPHEDKACVIRHDCRKRVEIPAAPKPVVTTEKRVQVEPFTPEETYRLRKFLELLKPVQ